jgi:hypothetical protein
MTRNVAATPLPFVDNVRKFIAQNRTHCALDWVLECSRPCGTTFCVQVVLLLVPGPLEKRYSEGVVVSAWPAPACQAMGSAHCAVTEGRLPTDNGILWFQ